jgi:hypothetical protein
VTQVRARTTEDGVMQPVRRPRWQRLCLSSFLLTGLTGLILWAAVDALVRQGGLGTVLAAGQAEMAAPLLVALVVATGICERICPAERRPVLARGHVHSLTGTGLDGRPVPVEQDGSPGRCCCSWPSNSPSRSTPRADPSRSSCSRPAPAGAAARRRRGGRRPGQWSPGPR